MKRPPKKTTTKGGNNSVNESRFRTARWVVGFVLLALGVYIFITLCNYLVDWKQGAMSESTSGTSGTWISSLLISDSFGLFGLLVPLMLIIFFILLNLQSLIRRISFSP